MVKVIIEHVLEFDEDFILDNINIIREWEYLKKYEKFEDIPTEELEIWIYEADELIKEEMSYSDYQIKQIIIENDDNN